MSSGTLAKWRMMNQLKLRSEEQGALPRRGFLKHFVLGTAFSTILGKEWLATVLADCEPTTPTGGILRVKISDFPALQAENGSVRLLLNPINALTQLPSGFFYPIVVNRGTGNQFFGLRSQCTHAGCAVLPFSTTANAIVCPCHNSRYALDGSLISGAEPGFSQAPLTQYPVTFDGIDLLCIEIPSLRYSLTASTVESGIGPRFRLQFQTRQGVNYEIRFRQSLSDAGTLVPFSTTESGPATTNVLTGNNQIRTIYVDRTTAAGFYTVSVQVNSG